MRSWLRSAFVLLVILALSTVFLALLYRPPGQFGIPETQRAYFDITLSQSGIDPDVIEVKMGTHVFLNLTSSDVDYWFTVPDFGVSARVGSNKTESVNFLANRADEFPLVCTSVSGQIFTKTGTLIVTP